MSQVASREMPQAFSAVLDKQYLGHILSDYNQGYCMHAPLSLQVIETQIVHQSQVLQKWVQEMLDQKAIEKVDVPMLAFSTTFFLVPKKDGIRPVVNLKKLNKFIHTPSFRMHTPQLVLKMIYKDNWLASLDLNATCTFQSMYAIADTRGRCISL